jgi:MFS family permease
VLLTATGIAVVRLVHEDFARPQVMEPGARGLGAAWRLVVGSPGLLALIATLFFVQAGTSAVSPILPLFVGELSGGRSGVATLSGLVLGAGAATGALAAGFAGRVGDRLGHARVVGGCALLGALFYLPQAAVRAPWQLLALRAAQGTFTGGLIPGVMAIVAVGTPVERRGLIFGLTATATALGSAAGPVAGAAVASAFGLRAAFVVTAVVLSAAGGWVIAALRPSAGGVPTTSRRGAAGSPAVG